MSLALAVTQSSAVTLDMSRPDDACIITRRYPVLGAFVERHPLSGVRATRLDVSRDKNGVASYRLMLLTVGGIVDLSSRSEALAVRNAQKAQIDAFLSGTDPTLHLAYEQSGARGVIWLVAGGVLLMIAVTPWQRARITVDPASRMVLVERSRWPLRAATQSIPVGEIARVGVRSFSGTKGRRTYGVVLVLASDQEVRLLRGASSASSVHQRAADRIQAALSQAGHVAQGAMSSFAA